MKGCSLGRLTQAEIEEFDLKGQANYERVIGIRESWRKGTQAGTWVQQEKDIGKRFRDGK